MKRDERKRNQIETRILTLNYANLRVKRSDDGKPVISGYAAVFNTWSENLGGFIERVKTGAFKEALKNSDTRALFNHDVNYPLGRESSNTLTLKEDKNGLYMEIDPPDTSYAKDLMISIERGDIREQSFGFTVESDTWEDQDKEIWKRTINQVGELFDVSPVTFAAYPDTSVALRSMDTMKEHAETSRNHKGVTAVNRAKLALYQYDCERI